MIAGHFIRRYGDSQRPDLEIEWLAGAAEETNRFLVRDKEAAARLQRVSELIEEFETPYGMELCSSVHWVVRHGEPPAREAGSAVEALHRWNERKRLMFTAEHIRVAWDRLAEKGWLAGTGGPDAVSPQPHPSAQGRCLCARFGQRPRGDPRGFKAYYEGAVMGEEVERFCAVYFKLKQRQGAQNQQAMNAARVPAGSRFGALLREKEEEAELFRSKVQAFRHLDTFLSQIIPYQDSDWERLCVFLRHLAAKLPPRSRGPTYQFDDEVRLEYYRLQTISEGSISLKEGAAQPLDGPTEVGAGPVHDEAVPLSQLIELINEGFGTESPQADQLFFDQIVEGAVRDENLRQAATVNPEDKFELVFRGLLERLFVERMDRNQEIFVRYMNDLPFREGVSAWLAAEAYKRLRAAGN